MNFKNDLREQMIQLLEEDGITFNKQESTYRLLISYLNALNKTISIRKRKVFISDNIERIIKDKVLNKKYINALLKFKEYFEDGKDMNGHLSTCIYCSDIFNKKKYVSNKAKDYLLDDWGIYHLHLRDKNAQNKEEMFSNRNDKEKGNRSEYLLFVKITDAGAYFIDILNHNEKYIFGKQELLETLDRNWHFLLEEYKLPELKSSSKSTNKEICKNRKSGSLSLYEVNGNVYTCIGGGITSAGTNIKHTNEADCKFMDMYSIEDYFKNNYDSIKDEIESVTGVDCTNKSLEFKFLLEQRGYVVKEINTNYGVLFFYEGNDLKARAGIVQD